MSTVTIPLAPKAKTLYQGLLGQERKPNIQDIYRLVEWDVDEGFKAARTKLKLDKGVSIKHRFVWLPNGELVHEFTGSKGKAHD